MTLAVPGVFWDVSVVLGFDPGVDDWIAATIDFTLDGVRGAGGKTREVADLSTGELETSTLTSKRLTGRLGDASVG